MCEINTTLDQANSASDPFHQFLLAQPSSSPVVATPTTVQPQQNTPLLQPINSGTPAAGVNGDTASDRSSSILELDPSGGASGDEVLLLMTATLHGDATDSQLGAAQKISSRASSLVGEKLEGEDLLLHTKPADFTTQLLSGRYMNKSKLEGRQDRRVGGV